ncbi:MAG TPA: sodium:proton antiporter, partial [Comamonadaceae bacterium]|nr:sodium:proton antiporter [Comamonadaceae bacterium]
FLGFLKGIEFSWTLRHILPETALMVAVLLVAFFVLDSWLYRREGEVMPTDPTPDDRAFGFDGGINFVLLLFVVSLVLMSGIWKSDVAF